MARHGELAGLALLILCLGAGHQHGITGVVGVRRGKAASPQGPLQAGVTSAASAKVLDAVAGDAAVKKQLSRGVWRHGMLSEASTIWLCSTPSSRARGTRQSDGDRLSSSSRVPSTAHQLHPNAFASKSHLGEVTSLPQGLISHQEQPLSPPGAGQHVPREHLLFAHCNWAQEDKPTCAIATLNYSLSPAPELHHALTTCQRWNPGSSRSLQLWLWCRGAKLWTCSSI